MRKLIPEMFLIYIRRMCIILLCIITVTSISAQTNSLSITKLMMPDSVIEEKLVQLAIEGPVYRGSDHQNKINEYQLKRAKSAWANLLTFSVNYNDQSFAKNNSPATENAYVYPKYFFGLTIPFGTLFSRTEVKSAREQIAISKDNQEQMARNIRADVLGKYKQYKNFSELIVLQSQIVDDEETAFLQAKEKYKNGNITIELHNSAQKTYSNELSKKLSLQLQQDIVKLEIEKVIGVSLESVMQN
jgi:outer membrane protein TolC